MHNVVFYDPGTGEIHFSGQMEARSISIECERLGLSALFVENYNAEYSVTHIVVDGELVEKPVD